MAIDVRANVTCSLGTLISASLSDDYVQQVGLVKTKGTLELSGLLTPTIGTAVTFSYTKDGVTRSVPRLLRVLSSFADPFRRTTKVELGCKLTYLSDLQEPLDWSALDDPNNAALTQADTAAPVAIAASSVMDECLTKLGLTASSNPLQNKFTERFDFSAGYVQVLSDLLLSENYCAYLDDNEVLQVFSLDQEGGTGPVLSSDKLIDVGAINVGELPGESVVVTYDLYKLAAPDGTPISSGTVSLTPWGETVNEHYSQTPVSYSDTNGAQQTIIYPTLQITRESTTYEQQAANGLLQTGAYSKVSTRVVTEDVSAVSVLGAVLTEFLQNGFTVSNPLVRSTTTEKVYYDNYGDEILRELNKVSSWSHAVGSFSLPMVFGPQNFVLPFYNSTFVDERQVVRTERAGDYIKTVTQRYGPWFKTINGQQTIAESRGSFASEVQVAAFIQQALQGEYLLDTTISTERSNSSGQRAPNKNSATLSNLADPAAKKSANNRVEQTSETVLALGSATAQRRITFNLPYASDDYVVKSGTDYVVTKGDADARARRFGIVQNRLFLGNRSGMSIQASPEELPEAPFAPLVVQANGLSALYRLNGCSWTISSEGIVASSDLLFWGAVGGTGSFWFPVAPGVTTLPTTPPVVSGQMTVVNVVPPYNVALKLQPTLRTGLTVVGRPYALSSSSTHTLTMHVKMRPVIKNEVASSNFELQPGTPTVSWLPPSVSVPSTSFELQVTAPTVSP